MLAVVAVAAAANLLVRNVDGPGARPGRPDDSTAASSPPPVPRPGGADRTHFGAAFQVARGEAYDEALARTDRSLGPLEVVRVFYPGPPEPWPGKAPRRNVVVSFKLEPVDVLAGKFDAEMRTWFETAPRDLDVFWVYFHEPENDIEEGSFTAEEFRAAFARLDGLADTARNPRLRSTLVLQSYTTRPESGRDWREFYPGSDVIDVFAWDVYNRPRRTGGYGAPEELLGEPRRIAESVGKPFAVAELGSVLVPGDDGSGRAVWLRSIGEYLIATRAPFVTYFDFSWNGGADDYRLRDPQSQQVWAAFAANPDRQVTASSAAFASAAAESP